MVELVNYDQNNYNVYIIMVNDINTSVALVLLTLWCFQRNGPFTNVKWSDAFIEDMRVYPPHAVNAMQILQGHISQIAGNHR